MALTVDNIVDRVSRVLNDVEHTRWPVAELVQWVNDGQVETVNLVPSAYTVTDSISLVAGTEQSTPADCLRVMDITRNDTVNTTRAVRRVDRKLMDTESPDWHSATQTEEVRNYLYSPSVPTVFHVYPPNDGTGTVRMVYSALPALVFMSDTLTIHPSLHHSLVDYVLYRAYDKETEHSAKERANTHYDAYLKAINARVQGDAAVEAI